jgi:7,8-dihydropterin-6-yl-methyl-4-(beta-D-ribofuranosyl)aminobenzene 5'-phosphate synthase
MPEVPLMAVDAVEVTIVIDLYLDLLMAGQEGVRRLPLAYDWSERDNLLAEHGFSALIRVTRNGQTQSILYDAGLSPNAVRNNLDVMDLDVTDMRAIVLSHGHADHHGGLEGLFQRYGRLRMPLVLHPDAFKDRKIVLPTGAELHLPPPSANDLDREGLTLVEERGPSFLVDQSVLVSGQVERTTDYEKGFSAHQTRTQDGGWEPDPWIWDDQNVIVNVRDRGLVVVSGCSHAGAVNVLRNARRLTGEPRILAFLGGLHLTGGLFEPIIPPTVADIQAMGVEQIVPAHCTGWRATHAIARDMPDAFVQPSVGTTFRYEGRSP